MDITKVILVDESDHAVGECEKLKAHTDGLLHRAFSVFIFNSKGEMLLQRRALDKYHSGGLWTNACCSHPAPGEETAAAALRRLKEEMGFITPVEKILDFVYKTDFENGLTEYEFDHVFVGYYDGEIRFNSDEVMAFRYMDIDSVRNWLESDPEQFTVWFRIAFQKIPEWKATNKSF